MATVEWPEKLSPFVTVGRVHLPRQDISRPENFEKGDALAFNQWRVTADHRPLGEIMNVRRIYSASAKVRRDAESPAADQTHQHGRSVAVTVQQTCARRCSDGEPP
jgi:hypothetical protein